MPDLLVSLAGEKPSNKVKNQNLGVQEDGEATDEEEQDSQDSESWMTMDQGKLQGTRDKNFQRKVRGSLNKLNSVRLCFLIKT